jgi:hypothetical protein
MADTDIDTDNRPGGTPPRVPGVAPRDRGLDRDTAADTAGTVPPAERHAIALEFVKHVSHYVLAGSLSVRSGEGFVRKLRAEGQYDAADALDAVVQVARLKWMEAAAFGSRA